MTEQFKLFRFIKETDKETGFFSSKVCNNAIDSYNYYNKEKIKLVDADLEWSSDKLDVILNFTYLQNNKKYKAKLYEKNDILYVENSEYGIYKSPIRDILDTISNSFIKSNYQDIISEKYF